jgi:hypothetical protein
LQPVSGTQVGRIRGRNASVEGRDMARYRRSKIKRQHHVLPELEDALARISAVPAVSGIIPGEIRPKAGNSTGLRIQYRTPSGFKLIGRAGGAAQEIFVITADPDTVLAALRASRVLVD